MSNTANNYTTHSKTMKMIRQPLMRADFTLFDEYKFAHEARARAAAGRGAV